MKPPANPAMSAVSLRLPIGRSHFLFALIGFWFAALLLRALYLQGLQNDFLQQKGESRYARVLSISAHRGVISDRNNELLAISTPLESIWVSPAEVRLSAADRSRLVKLLGLDSIEINRRLADTSREFLYLKRHVSPERAATIAALKIPGVFSQREYKRFYPAGEELAHVIGFTGMDDNGQEGLELAYQDSLAGKPGSRQVIKDRRGHIIEQVGSQRAPVNGEDLALSIDRRIQYLAHRELKAAVAANHARAGAAIVLDVKTGEVLAMANVPTYNPNNRGKLDRDRTRNRAITDLFEPGSTLKPFTVAAVLEAGAFNADSVIDVAPGWLRIGRATIRDAHRHDALTVAQVIQKSSNVGSVKLALSLPPQALWDIFHDVGFGVPPSSGFPGEAAGKLRAHKSWKPIEHATMSYGHGISVSLLQLARAYTVFAADGRLKPVSLIKLDAKSGPVEGRRVLSPETAKAVREMLETVVQPGGTALKAQIMGYRVAGKTGTAHKAENGSYAARRYISSFVGFAPASDPRLVVAVMIDEPNAGQHFGGAVAAPVFSSVMSGALRMLSVAPDAPAGSDAQDILPPDDETIAIKEEI
ncbi:MAG: peptidoglycan D,D-transpeptidase FtsI family protein [Burkholderiales bacterium]|nr:penicillin-binding protein 2 [Pseudomonadota bacterium]